MASQVRFNGRFVVELPIVNLCNRKAIITNGKMHIVEPPQLEEAIVRGTAISLIPVNNTEECHRDPIEGGNVELGAGKLPQYHEVSPMKTGRQSPSRILAFGENLLREGTPVDYTPIRGLWKKSGVCKK